MLCVKYYLSRYDSEEEAHAVVRRALKEVMVRNTLCCIVHLGEKTWNLGTVVKGGFVDRVVDWFPPFVACLFLTLFCLPHHPLPPYAHARAVNRVTVL